MEKIPEIAVIAGPTASGKTGLSIRLAKLCGGEIISADSMQIYKKLNIGTAKVGIDEQDGVPHHMIDFVEPEDSYSVAQYTREADLCVQDVLSRGKIPIIVGGTGLYIDSLVRGRDFAGDMVDEELRNRLEKEYLELGGEYLLEKLKEIDPERGAKLHASDRKRLIRALEIFYTTGKTITEHDEESRKMPPKYRAKFYALSYENREDLYNRINLRVDIMMEQGLLNEVEEILAQGVPKNATSMQAIGYKEIISAIDGEISMDEAIEKIKQESRRYAKRQLTWFRRNKEINWFYWEKEQDLLKLSQISTAFSSDFGIK